MRPRLIAGLSRALPPLLAIALLALAAPATAGEIHAVLAGASDYPRLEQALRDAGDSQADRVNLKGARNDAVLMAQTLISRGAKPANIVLLIEHPERGDYPLPPGVTVAGAPTRGAIEAAVRGLARQVKPGDEAVILLSGHGSQQPQRGTLEADGLDEIFIPVDHGTWNGAQGEVANAIVDDEIADWIAEVRGAGADVLYIGDFCHSGDSVRGAAGGPAAIDFPHLLGVPRPAMDMASDRAMAAFRGRPAAALHDGDRPSHAGQVRAAQGGFVAFMAAPSDTRADQVLGPVYLPRPERRPGGVLSMYLAAALSDPTVRTYREAATRVQAGYSAQNVPSTPEFEGDLEAPVLGGSGEGRESAAWTVFKPQTTSLERLTLNAGGLQGVTEGAIIALSEVQLNRGAAEAVILYGRVDKAYPGTSELVPVDFAGIPASRWGDVRTASGARFGWEAYLVARLVQNGAQFGFDVERPRPPAAPTAAQRAALAALDVLGRETATVRLNSPGTASDFILSFQGGDLVIARSPGAGLTGEEVGRLPLSAAQASSDPGGFLRQRISDALTRTLRAAKLGRVIETMDAAPRAGTPDAGADPAAGLELEWRVWLAPASAGRDGAPCPPAPLFAADRGFPPGLIDPAALGWTAADAPRLHPCDAAYLRLRNTGADVDVTGLVIEPSAAVSALKDPAYGVRLSGGTTGVYAWQFDPAPATATRVIDIAFIVVRADDNVRIHADYSSLAQCAATDTRCGVGAARTRSGDQPFAQGRARGFANLIDGVLDGETRSGSVGAAVGSSGVLRTRWRIDPQTGVADSGRPASR